MKKLKEVEMANEQGRRETMKPTTNVGSMLLAFIAVRRAATRPRPESLEFRLERLK